MAAEFEKRFSKGPFSYYLPARNKTTHTSEVDKQLGKPIEASESSL